MVRTIGEPLSDGFAFLVQTRTMKQLEEVTASIRVRDEQRSSSHQSHPYREEEENERENNREDEEDSVYGEADRTSHTVRLHRRNRSNTQGDRMDRKPGQKFKGAHGEMEWGDAPKKSFVLLALMTTKKKIRMGGYRCFTEMTMQTAQ